MPCKLVCRLPQISYKIFEESSLQLCQTPTPDKLKCLTTQKKGKFYKKKPIKLYWRRFYTFPSPNIVPHTLSDWYSMKKPLKPRYLDIIFIINVPIFYINKISLILFRIFMTDQRINQVWKLKTSRQNIHFPVSTEQWTDHEIKSSFTK